MEKTVIIKCTLEDWNDLMILGERCFREAYEPVDDPGQFQIYLDKAFNEAQLKSELDNPNSEFYFVKKEGALAGFIKVNEGTAQTEKMSFEYLELERIYLLKKYYGNGLGRLMIEKVIELGRSKNKKKIWLGVWEENQKAIEFYKHLGFEIIGEHTFVIGNIPERDWVMELTLV